MKQRTVFAACGAVRLLSSFTAIPVIACAQPPVPPPVTTPNSANGEQAEQAFKEANALLEQGKYAPALARYKTAEALAPGDPAILWNGGIAAFFARDYRTAISWWKQLKTGDPSNGRVRAKLIQAYQAAGRTGERDAERRDLLARQKTRTVRLDPPDRYCRDQFSYAGKQVFAYEHFALTGERALRYNFLVFSPGKNAPDFRVSLGSYKNTNDIARELGDLEPGQRLFHLDGYYENGREHKTFGFFTTEPAYDTVRQQVLRILDNKAEAVSSSRHGKP